MKKEVKHCLSEENLCNDFPSLMFKLNRTNKSIGESKSSLNITSSTSK